MDSKGRILMQKYQLGKFLGQGTTAKVYHARNIETGMSVAIKIIDKERIVRYGMIDQIQREISVMKLVRHPNIVQLYEVIASKAKIYFVMEYVRGGELFNRVAKGKLREGVARKYFQQLISAVEFCHSRGVYHRDLKPENLLVDDNGNLKISDFGLSALADSRRQDGLLHTSCGTPAYVAPEVVGRKGYDGTKADVWSCGVILFVLLSGALPFHDGNLMEMYRKIKEADFKYPSCITAEARTLISKLLDANADNRIPMSAIIKDPWFRKGLLLRARRNAKEGNKEDDAHPNKVELAKPPQQLNAFDIISLSSGLDLSGLFEGDNDHKKEVKFTSNQPAQAIVSKLEDLAKRLKLKVKKKDSGMVKFEGSRTGRKGVLSIDAEILEVTPSFHLVELRKSNGDTLEYQRLMKRDIRPSLKDIVWAWQGDGEPESLMDT